MTIKVLTVFGTRPEAIKLVPVVRAFEKSSSVEHALCVTGQHREMLRQVLDLFEVVPQYDLALMAHGQTLSALTAAVIERVSDVLDEFKPDRVVVQGDTTTSFCTALAAHYRKIPVAHVEAGLRSFDLYAPWPEEANRRLISVLADIHFAPTEIARDHLLREGTPADAIHVTGNTGIDTLLLMRERLESDAVLRADCKRAFPFLDREKRLVLVTGHRRESFGAGLSEVFQALADLAKRRDVQIVFPVHLNPAVQEPARAILAEQDNVFLLPPLDYPQFVFLMNRAALIITDSGGIQEEAPALGRPVLVTRTVTERPEGIQAGAARLVGTSGPLLVAETTTLLDDKSAYAAMATPRFLYGDGHAAERIADILPGAHNAHSRLFPESRPALRL